MNKAILAVSFGTSHEENLNKSIGAIETCLKDNFKNYKICRAFTSRRIIKKLWEKSGIEVPSLEEAVIRIRETGIEHLVVQPAYVVHGFEYERLKDVLEDYRDCFKTLKIGRPLLHREEDYKACVHCAVKDWRIARDEIIVIAGHGTQGDAQPAFTMLEYVFHSMGYTNVLVGTVRGYPGISDVMQKLRYLDPGPIRIIPFMIVSGEHVRRDLAVGENSWLSRFGEAGYHAKVVERGLGEIEGIRKIFAEHVKEAMES